jgi:hypothetical protein
MNRVVRIALTVSVLLLLAATGFVALDFVLMCSPASSLLLLLFNGVRPGERLIERHRRRLAPVRATRRDRRRVPALRAVPRRGRLVVSGLAMRPPPVAAS